MNCPQCHKIMVYTHTLEILTYPGETVQNYACFGCGYKTTQSQQRPSETPSQQWHRINPV